MFIVMAPQMVGAPLGAQSHISLLAERKKFLFVEAINILLLRSKD
jgi:hypothetical protein